MGLRGLWGLWSTRKEGNRNEKGSNRAETESLWVCGSEVSVGLWVWGSVGLRGLWGPWGAGKEGNRNEKGSKRAETESAGPKGAFRRFSEVPSTTTSTVFRGFGYLGGRQGQVLAAFWELLGSILKEKSGNGEHRPQKSVQVILRGSQYDEKYRIF